LVKFIECLNDAWDFFFLADPANLSKFKSENDLSNDLIAEFTSNDSVDLAVKDGIIIPLSGIANYPYHIIFQVNSTESIFSTDKNDLQFRKSGYLLEVINNEIYLITVPYLKDWSEEGGIQSLKSNGIRPRINLDDGLYAIEILGGEIYQEGGWEPTIEFILQKEEKDKEEIFNVKDINFNFYIESKEY